MKTRILYVFTFVFVALSLHAQPASGRFTKEEVINRKWISISKKIDLPAEELTAIETIFRANEEEVWDLLTKHRETMRSLRGNRAETSKDYEAINAEIVKFDMDNAKLRQKYYQSLKKKVSPEIVNKLLIAEKVYQRELMQKSAGRGSQPANLNSNKRRPNPNPGVSNSPNQRNNPRQSRPQRQR